MVTALFPEPSDRRMGFALRAVVGADAEFFFFAEEDTLVFF